MLEIIPIIKKNANAEVVARILKATSHKYDCTMEIDFSEGERKIEFVGHDDCKQLIIEDVRGIFEGGREN
ncbi:MAG: hypothetical protein GY859_13415 [Desulfobacterales bacterium]|nr:hypothetical protein [Desulfobacterales bacterium]